MILCPDVQSNRTSQSITRFGGALHQSKIKWQPKPYIIRVTNFPSKRTDALLFSATVWHIRIVVGLLHSVTHHVPLSGTNSASWRTWLTSLEGGRWSGIELIFGPNVPRNCRLRLHSICMDPKRIFLDTGVRQFITCRKEENKKFRG